jgi:hypothetical protein
MDPATLAGTAMTIAKPYVAALGKGAATAAGKSVWNWVKGKMTTETGKLAIKDLESGPDDIANQMAVQAALIKLLRSEPSALSELTQLLDKVGTTSATLSVLVTGDRNNVGQVAGSGIVSISRDKTS